MQNTHLTEKARNKTERHRLKEFAGRDREIACWEREKARPRRNTYLLYLVFIITLIYTTDEIASQIAMLMKTETANDLFAGFGASSVSALEILGVMVVPLLRRLLMEHAG